MTETANTPDLNLITMTVDITSAYLNHNSVATSELPAVIESIHAALDQARRPLAPQAEPLVPAVPIRASIKPDYLVCLEDGKQLRMLKRYLRTQFNLTPQEYREKWGLPRDYPMVAPSYAAHRATIAEATRLGRKPVTRKDDNGSVELGEADASKTTHLDFVPIGATPEDGPVPDGGNEAAFVAETSTL